MKSLYLEVKNDLQSFSICDWILLASTAALFLPFQYAAAAITTAVLFFLCTGKLIPALKEQTGKTFLYTFIALQLTVSALYGNTIGLLNAAGYLLGALYIATYRKLLSPRLFQYILELMILMSWLAALYGLCEFQIVSSRQGYDFFDFVIQNRPEDRINSTFKNANFYATMCDFFILFCVYEYINTSRKGNRIYYVATALANFFMLFLTGCRTAILPFLFIFPIFFGCARKKKLFILSCAAELAALALILAYPAILPRMDSFSTLYSRMKIWDGALVLISMHPWFGMGPQTYGFMYEKLGFHKAPHAHNLILDALTSFGIVGTALGLGYLLTLTRETFQALGKNKYSSQFALIVSTAITAMILGLLDCTLNFVVTGITFMMVANSACLFTPEKTGTETRPELQ